MGERTLGVRFAIPLGMSTREMQGPAGYCYCGGLTGIAAAYRWSHIRES
jgi:hypothetical protein